MALAAQSPLIQTLLSCWISESSPFAILVFAGWAGHGMAVRCPAEPSLLRAALAAPRRWAVLGTLLVRNDERGDRC